jgi:hypothetical protein
MLDGKLNRRKQLIIHPSPNPKLYIKGVQPSFLQSKVVRNHARLQGPGRLYGQLLGEMGLLQGYA